MKYKQIILILLLLTTYSIQANHFSSEDARFIWRATQRGTNGTLLPAGFGVERGAAPLLNKRTFTLPSGLEMRISLTSQSFFSHKQPTEIKKGSFEGPALGERFQTYTFNPGQQEIELRQFYGSQCNEEFISPFLILRVTSDPTFSLFKDRSLTLLPPLPTDLSDQLRQAETEGLLCPCDLGCSLVIRYLNPANRGPNYGLFRRYLNAAALNYYSEELLFRFNVAPI